MKTMSQRPEYLYKYMPPNEEYIREILVEQKLYHADPEKDFPDPFDCALSIRLKHAIGNKEISKQFAEMVCKDKLGCENRINSFLIDEEFAADFERNERDGQLSTIRELNVRVLCLTVDYENPLMWSHYAYKHKGIVIQFKVDSMFDAHSNELRLFPVRYEQKFPSLEDLIKYHDDDERVGVFSLMNTWKSEDWRYEQEFRFFASESYVYMDKSCVSGIIFGMKSEENFRRTVKSYIEDSQFEIAEYYAEPAPDEFRMLAKTKDGELLQS